MAQPVPPDVDPGRPPRKPVDDPTLGITLTPDTRPFRHRLVTIGDSLTHGFQGAAIFNTSKSWPAIVAHEMGLGGDGFRVPVYGGPGDGMPLNLEALLHRLEGRFGSKIDWWESPGAAIAAYSFMSDVEDYWERGEGATPPAPPGPYHNLGIYGWDLRDAMHWTAENLPIGPPKNDRLNQLPQDHNQRAARQVLASAPGETQVGAARRLGEDGGIETLVVGLGANNALGSIVSLQVLWTDTGYDDPKEKDKYTVWRPSHFRLELQRLADLVRAVNARHVIWPTVPHVTIVPLARGVGEKLASLDHRYFSHYTRVWIPDDEFDPDRDPHFTGEEARAVDSAIDCYNDAIEKVVREARSAGLDWLVCDHAALLDGLAFRRYLSGEVRPPDGWRPYELPAELKALDPVPSTLFFQAGESGRSAGGLFSLDGVHPTTIGYGIMALEVMKVMHGAGVAFPGGAPRVDFGRLVRMDTLIQNPPKLLSRSLRQLGWIDEKLDFVNGALGSKFGERLFGKKVSLGF